MAKKTFYSVLLVLLIAFWSYNHFTQPISTSTQNQKYEKVIYLPSDRYPETAQHIKEAESAGESSICTIDRKDVKEHRKESLEGIETKAGYDRDEFPMAMCAEGGKGANVKLVHSSDNRGAGAWVSHQLSGLPDGTKVLIQVK